MNPNDAELRRVFTRESATNTSNTPDTTLKVNQPFEVVVQAEAGTVITGSKMPYQLYINAIDLTAVGNPGFTRTIGQIFDPATGNVSPWPTYEQSTSFTAPAALAGHLVQFNAALVSTNDIVSFVESDPVIFIN